MKVREINETDDWPIGRLVDYVEGWPVFKSLLKTNVCRDDVTTLVAVERRWGRSVIVGLTQCWHGKTGDAIVRLVVPENRDWPSVLNGLQQEIKNRWPTATTVVSKRTSIVWEDWGWDVSINFGSRLGMRLRSEAAIDELCDKLFNGSSA